MSARHAWYGPVWTPLVSLVQVSDDSDAKTHSSSLALSSHSPTLPLDFAASVLFGGATSTSSDEAKVTMGKLEDRIGEKPVASGKVSTTNE